MKISSLFLALSLALVGCGGGNDDGGGSGGSTDGSGGSTDGSGGSTDGSGGSTDGSGGSTNGSGGGSMTLPTESMIVSPGVVSTIAQGTSLVFTGSCSGANADASFTYDWDFNGAADQSNAKEPGEIQFDTPGRYRVTLGCSAGEGLADSTPASVLVIVRNRIMVTTTADELNDDSNCSLREAVLSANTDSPVSGCAAGSGWDLIELGAGDYVLDLAGADEDMNATGDLDISASLSIIGAGLSSTSIDGNGTDRLLHVLPTTDGVHLDLQGIELTEGAAQQGGAVLIESGQVVIRDSVLTNNTAVDTGGGVHLSEGVLTLKSVTLSANQATNSVLGHGGGLYNAEGVVRIADSLISQNSAYRGGGVFSNKGSVWLSTTQVLENVSPTDGGPTYGGGIFADSGSLHLERNSEVANHEGASFGGGIYLTENTLFTMTDSRLHDNSAHSGGGLYGLMKAAQIRRSVIENNVATSDPAQSPDGSGGGLYLENSDVLFEESELNNNEAAKGGGLYQIEGTLILSDSLVAENRATYGGGFYQDAGGGTYLMRTILRENLASNDGGAVYLTNGGTYAEDSSFEENSAGRGGALWSEEYVAMVLDRCTFQGNEASQDGGAIYLYDYGVAEIRNCTLSGNSAIDKGGAIYIYYPNADIQYTTITNNSAGISGGGIYSEYLLSPQNSILAGNQAQGSLSDASADCAVNSLLSGGHNLFGLNTGCAATRYDKSIAGDEVTTKVLGALADNGGALLKDKTHPLSHALLSGSPAIDAAWDEYCLEVDQTGTVRALGNACDLGSVESSGAAVSVTTLNLILVNTTDDELNSDGDCSLREAIEAANTDAAVDGCAAGDGWDTVQVPAGTYALSIAGDKEDNNQTGDLDVLAPLTLEGASAATTVIDAQQNDRVLDVRDVTLRASDIALKNGRSEEGGCLRNKDGHLTLMNNEVSLCESTGNGGGVFNRYGAGHIFDSSIHDTSANNGGGLHNDGGLVSIQGGFNFRNSASMRGGGLNSEEGATRISGVELYSNEANAGGGGVELNYGVAIFEKNSLIHNNKVTVRSGGAGIYTSKSATLVRDSIIRDNQSVEFAGGMDANGGVWVVSSTIEGNTALTEGGGVEGNGIYQQTTFQNNEAESGGGLHGSGILQESVISENISSTGGGLYASGYLIYGSTISGNRADEFDGGGVYLKDGGGVCLFESSVEDNEATLNSLGAGIYVESQDVSLVLSSSSITGQSGVSSGGGLYNLGVADIINSTFSGNSAEGAAGIYNGATLSLLQSTVADNSALLGSAGGLLNAGSAIIQSTIIAGNAANQSLSDPTADCSTSGAITASSFNLVGENTGCAFDSALDQSIAPTAVFVDLLSSLEKNKLGTRNHKLMADSLALDQLPCLLLLDQVGTARPQESLCDSGAIEWFAEP